MDNYGNFHFVVLVLGSLFFSYCIAVSAEFKMKTTCFVGRPSYFICDFTERISIKEITYERNCNVCNTASCQSSKYQCDNFTVPGSWINNFYYDKLSGNYQGGVIPNKRAPCGPAQIYSNRLHLLYQCLDDSNIIPFCGNIHMLNGTDVYIQYKHKTSQYPMDCSCTAVSSDSERIKVRALDIRFQENANGRCGAGQNSFLNFYHDSSNSTYKCENEKIIGEYKNIYSSNGSRTDIKLHLETNPLMVWIAISASNGGKVSVSCKMDTILTTTPPTTTMSTVMTTTPLLTLTSLSSVRPTTTFLSTQSNVQSLPTSRVSTTSITTSNRNNISNGMTIEKSPNASTIPHYRENTTDPDKIFSTMKTILPTKNTIGSGNVLKSKKQREHIDPAIIALVVAGVLVWILIVIGGIIGRMKYKKRRERRALGEFRNKVLPLSDQSSMEGKQDVHTDDYLPFPERDSLYDKANEQNHKPEHSSVSSNIYSEIHYNKGSQYS